MNRFIKLFGLIVLCQYLVSCAGQPVEDDGDFAFEEGAMDIGDDDGDLADGGDFDSQSEGDFDDLDDLDDQVEKEKKVAEGDDGFFDDDPLSEVAKSDQGSLDAENGESDFSDLGDSVTEATGSEDQLADTKSSFDVEDPKPLADSSEPSDASFDPLLDLPPSDSEPTIVSPSSPMETVDPQAELTTTTTTKAMASEIGNIKFEGHDGGGSIIIEGNQPLDFSTRMNRDSNQYVVEINNVRLPSRLKRPFITKDFPSSIGSIDAYQTPGSDSVKVVVQLREGGLEPTAHTEGNSIIVIPPAVSPETIQATGSPTGSQESPLALTGSDGILSSKNLEQFLSGNMKYYGKKISIEVRDWDVRDAIKFIADESGANLVMSEGISGTLALKLKEVPWDQALVLILKAKKLGYTRQGNVLRISPMAEIKQEEEEAMKLVESRRKIEPLKVQMIPINYAKIVDLQGQIKSVISERGNIVADARTNSLIITETEEVLDRAKKIIASLDIAPAQVLIEGKLVEARESFNKRLGIHWDVMGGMIELGDGARGPINMNPNLNIRPGVLHNSSLGFNLTLGTLNMLGDLNAVLALEEQEENVRVISSPRIVTLHNEDANITQSATVPVVTAIAQRDGMKTYRDLELKMDLKVTPEIASNGVVQMKVDISRQFLGAPRADGTAGTNTRTAKTKVMVKSGQTAVIGGIYQNDTSQLEHGVPFLRDIPLIGFLFRDRNFQKSKTELLLFLTPRILSQAGSAVALQDLESSANSNGDPSSSLE